MSQEATAELAGMTGAYLSMIERGVRPVTRRSTLESLADALRVAPSELTGQPYVTNDPLTSEIHAALSGVESALEVYELGVDPGVKPRPWSELSSAVQHLTGTLRGDANYAEQGAVLPDLLGELHTAYVHDPQHRREVLIALVYSYRTAASVCKNLGVRGLPLLAARAAQRCTEELGDPEWLGYAAYLRGIMGGPQSRSHQYTLSVRAIDGLTASMSGSSVLQVAGTLHLNAALAAAVQRDADQAHEHLNEAARLADELPPHHSNFAGLYFGHDNVALWMVSLGTELGEGPKVAELARNGRPEVIPLRSWQATYFADLGRALATDRKTRDVGLRQILKAESIAPQWTRNNPLVRETVLDLLAAARRDAGGRDLRGLAHRMGVAPTG
ncbi:transcriptional regulator with XRE-family HTH domain [Saccharopolyspora phatthalungensis]|uniref:Transcriptional regulator with XRE-family HTH domain n=2 Tax=Saccharopolyspora phatthalungensis TaxID=664693 RepID=A0A840QHE1_9PSEU|nr:transcriptional regulator with XRE-family HTH domain [Saccharopolyspora phatthalungensis]